MPVFTLKQSGQQDAVFTLRCSRIAIEKQSESVTVAGKFFEFQWKTDDYISLDY